MYLRTLPLPPLVPSSFVRIGPYLTAMLTLWQPLFSRTTHPPYMGSPLQFTHSSRRPGSLGRMPGGAEQEGQARLVILAQVPAQLAEETSMVCVRHWRRLTLDRCWHVSMNSPTCTGVWFVGSVLADSGRASGSSCS